MVDIGGSYFPSWMICLAASVSFALGLRAFLRYRGLEEKIAILPLFYPGTVLFVSCALWLALFR